MSKSFSLKQIREMSESESASILNEIYRKLETLEQSVNKLADKVKQLEKRRET
jgi:hypothetical protein